MSDRSTIESSSVATKKVSSNAAGDVILFAKYTSQDIKVDGEEYLIMREDEVLAVVVETG
jgi:co-chaperonin GroES (HSP10)